jgi:mono/diheme cytochrome c family protein
MIRKLCRTRSASLAAAILLYVGVAAVASLRAAQQPEPTSLSAALPGGYTGEDVFRLACSTCHGLDGKGSPQSVVGFDAPLPDFTDCKFTTPEPIGDWMSVIHEGGPVRGLDRHMPAFGDALSEEDIDKVIRYVWTFCQEPAWPRGDLNFPRAFFTEKAYPENETVWTTAITAHGSKAVGTDVVYERRFGIRNQLELIIPVDFQQGSGARGWSRGLGDVAFALRRTFYSSLDRGRIAAAGGEVSLPTGKEGRGLGNGFAVYEPFAMWGQILPHNAFLQMHGGFEIPSDQTAASKEAYLRTAIGTSFAQDRGFGRAWSPQLEVLWAHPFGGLSEWDVVPEMQVTLSKLQHIMIAGGVRIPVNEREERHTQVLTYFLWDWFDGGLFEFWR